MLNIAKIWAAIIGFFVLSTLVFTEVAKADICNQSDYVVTNISGTTVDYGDTQWPVKTIVFSDAFGSRTLGENYDFHRGIDLKGEEGDAVYSIADGVVTKVQEDCDPGSSDCPYAKGGKVVVIKHSLPEGVQFLLEGRSFSKYYSVYQHLHDFNTDNGKLQEEQQVNKGSRIGSLGRTGATYAHLHLETRVGTTCSGESQIRGSCKPFGAKIIDPSVNPLYFLNEQSRAYVNDNNYQVCVTKNPQVNVEFFSPRTELDFNEIEVVYNGGTKIINFSRKTGINLAFVDKNPYDGVQIIPSDFRSSTPQYIIKFDFQNLTDFEEINIRDIWGNGKKIVPVTSPISTPR